MKQLALTFVAAFAVLASACSKEEAATGTSEAVPPAADVVQTTMNKASEAASTAAESMGDAAEMAASTAGQGIDHARDEAEFMLKRSLAGLESLKEDIKDTDYLAEIDKDIADLKAKLDAM